MKQSTLIITFCMLVMASGAVLCQQVPAGCDEKVFDGNKSSFNDLIKKHVVTKRRIIKNGKDVSIYTPSDITQLFNRYATTKSGYFRKNMIQREFEFDRADKNAKAEYELNMKRLDILLSCGVHYITNKAKGDKKYRKFAGYAQVYSKVYNYIKNILLAIRKEYRSNPKYFNSNEALNVLDKLKSFEIELALVINEVIYDSDVWKKYIEKQSSDKIYPHYYEFFKSYENLKKKLNTKQLSQKEILYYLFQTGTLKTNQGETIRSEEDVVTKFNEKLKNLAIVLNKSWFVKVSLNDVKEIISALTNLYPNYYSTAGAIEVIQNSQDFSTVFMVAVGADLYEIIKNLQQNIGNLIKY